MPPHEIHTLSCEDAIAFVCDATWGFAEIDEHGKFAWANRTYCEILNAPIELILGTHFSAWTHEDDRKIAIELAEQVARGTIPGYTLAKRYLQRGTTPQNPRIVWGMLSVSGKWLETQDFVGYRVQFQPYTQPNAGQMKPWLRPREIVAWTLTNWRTLVTIAAVVMSLTAAGSAQLSESLKRAKEAVQSVDSVLQDSSHGGSPAQP